ncbi:hypothetical protein G3N56_05045 [Desulfovibrio sulfodismutans]|uniref:Acylneuraminate cytidylyltransferase family protein n=1 Tax=Desulfolutivibrio sulfodismutans TaxID=63561 RepID=A0A7K3NIT2_9BACT|nr:hypothetical protein [Desulfolutivibrio sulfodismutans]NDY56112.1 hypothetical protein [Desulfolutivibrio sulfodismutans]QLA13165.1 hypothetical protein GD606_13255 [Desulfolutivibrio sulfodismutans DSM 3696]
MAKRPVNVGFIMARGGGSTFYRKNAYPILGRPVLAWAIDTMQRAGFIDHIYVWTEDQNLADIAEKAGAIHLERPRDMVHYYSGAWTIGQWQHLQDRQIKEHLDGEYDYIVPFNCNCIGLRPESLRAMYDALRLADEKYFRILPVCRIKSGLCMHTPTGGHLFPFWNDKDKPLGDTLLPLYRLIGVGIVHRTKANTGDVATLYHEVPEYEGFDFQSRQDIPFAEYYMQSRLDEVDGATK